VTAVVQRDGAAHLLSSASGAKDLPQKLKQPDTAGLGRNGQHADCRRAWRQHKSKGDQSSPAFSPEVTFAKPEIIVANHSRHAPVLSQQSRGITLLSEASCTIQHFMVLSILVN
jgi:hypothetical protein